MLRTIAALAAFTLLIGFSASALTGCSSRQERVEHYVSSQVQGESAKINLEEVQKAFWDTKGQDFNGWMSAFEKRVNEIYDGEGVVAIDASRKTGQLTVTGYIENKKEQGYQSDEEKLFSIEQTGDVSDNELPYRVAGHDGVPYYEGHHSIMGSPIVQMMVLSHLMGGWGGRYYTPYDRVVVLRDHRDSFRSTATYTAQKTSNSDFNTRYKQKSSGGVMSKSKFGDSGFSSSSSSSGSKRSWNGFGSSRDSSSSSTGFSWGGKRSSRSSGGWGRRRR